MSSSRPIFIDHCIFQKVGGLDIIDAYNSQFTVTNCTFYSSVPGGDGISLTDCSLPVTIKNCVFQRIPVGINCSRDASRVMYNISNGEISTFNCYQAGPGNLEGSAQLLNDFRLPPTSPAIDAGDPADDYSHEPSCGGKNKRIDMGAFGNTPYATCKEDNGVYPALKRHTMTDDDSRAEMYSVSGRLLGRSIPRVRAGIGSRSQVVVVRRMNHSASRNYYLLLVQ
jgi:hypothetical protein